MNSSKKSFPEFYANESSIPFYIMLGLFVLTNMLLVINFIVPIAEKIVLVRMAINSVLLILCVMYIAFNLLIWSLQPLTVVVAIALIAIVGFGWNFIGQTNAFFCTIVAAFLSLLAYQRDYKTILKIVLVCHITTMLFGIIGLFFGFTELAYKIGSTDIGLSLGLIYPNHVGRMIFLIFMIIWYLWGQEKKLITTIIAFILAIIMWFVIECKTITIFLIGFPICWFISTWFRESITKKTVLHFFKRIWDIILVAMPFLCMGLTYILGRFRLFFMEHWHYGQGIYALWMRFISAGILFNVYKFPLFGRDILEENAPMEFIKGQFYMADVVDNAYIYYLIAIGGIALIACMLWISFANYQAIKNKDHAFLLMSFFMCGYGLIEIVFFQFEHNFLFFYPLTATALTYRSKENQEQQKQPVSDEQSDIG